MASWLNSILTKWKVWLKGMLAKWQIGKLAEWKNGNLTKYHWAKWQSIVLFKTLNH
jgi:hypothetical protein